MVSQSIIYIGQLRCKAIHGPSGVEFVTDAPVDNHGRGESFSPTDLVAAALATCQITTMGITAQREGIDLDGTNVHVEKHMSSAAPRRITKLVVHLEMAPGIANAHRAQLEQIARTCPVALSIHPEIQIDCQFTYPD